MAIRYTWKTLKKPLVSSVQHVSEEFDIWCCHKHNPPPSEPSSHQWWKWCRVKVVCCLRTRSQVIQKPRWRKCCIDSHYNKSSQPQPSANPTDWFDFQFERWNLQLLWSAWATSTSWFTTELHLWHTKIEDNQLGCNLGEPTKDLHCILLYIWSQIPRL